MIPCAAILLASIALLHAESSSSSGPAAAAWLLYEQGRKWSSQGELGKALQSYRNAILAAGVMPEAEAAIGDIYRAEGEFQLAVRQYERAYNLRNALRIPAEQYDILYRWASLYEDQEMYEPMERKLLLIVAGDTYHRGEQLPIQVERNYIDKGLDHVLVLYRFDSYFAIAAHSRLGWFYYRTGRYLQAVRHLLYAVILQVSDVADFLKQRDAAAAITSLDGFLAQVVRYRESRSWLEGASLPSDLYYLSAAAWELGHPVRAQSVWKTLANLKEAGKYSDLSRRQLLKPFREPFLEPTFRLDTGP